ncbi:MAG: hypothetical protein GY842_25050 [bacterium]|nr:hypothetical protein [bacterium]
MSRTSDGGDNWLHTVLPTDEDFYAVHFVDQRIGWAAGGYVGHGSYGHSFPDGISIWSTADGGASWRCSPRIAFGRAEPHAHPETIYGLVFRDRQEGWAVTHGMMKKSKPCEYGRVLRTTNGGAAWEQVYLGAPLAKVVYKDGVLLAAGYLLLRSKDGINWEEVIRCGPKSGIAFANSRHAVAVGSGYLESWDAGATWQPATPLPFQNEQLYTVGFTDEATGWIGSSSFRDTPWGVYHTADAGRSWKPRMIHNPGEIGPDNHGTLNEICTLGTGHAWALWKGGILRLAGPQAERVDSEP